MKDCIHPFHSLVWSRERKPWSWDGIGEEFFKVGDLLLVIERRPRIATTEHAIRNSLFRNSFCDFSKI
jgi:hypothetical protein